MRKITIGTDPEYFMRNKSNGQLISAIPFIKGSKQVPHPLKSGGNIQADNVAVEFSTVPAVSTLDFIVKLKETFREAIEELPDGMELAALPSAEFDPDQLKDPKACEFGCEPDYCAWGMCENPVPVPPSSTFRSCGGHIHVGCLHADGSPVHPDSQFLLEVEGKVLMVRGMDLFHGVISTILDSSPAAVKRKKLYGKSGCHRPTTYGVEYRTLSAFWTKTPYSSMLVSSLTDDVVDLIVDNKLNALIEDVSSEEIRRIIDTGDVDGAKVVLNKYLMEHLSEDSKFYLEECLSKLAKADSIVKEWAITV